MSSVSYSQATYKYAPKGKAYIKNLKTEGFCDPGTPVSCNDLEKGILMIELNGVGPFASDSVKDARVERIDEFMKTVAEFKSCEQITGVCFHLGEGLFVRSSDNLDAEERYREFSEVGWQLDMHRFVERYQKQLDDVFDGKKVYLEIFQW